MQRIYPEGLARLGGYAVPPKFGRRDGDDGETAVDHLRRCWHSHMLGLLAALNSTERYDELVASVRQKGIGVLSTTEFFVMVPALAPLNAKTGGAPGAPLALSWDELLGLDLLLLFAPVSAPFSTATTSMRVEDARLQQAMRVVGKHRFALAAMSDDGLPGVPPDAWLKLDLEQLVVCQGCRNLRVANCTECRDRALRLQQFLNLPVRLLEAAMLHQKNEATRAVVTWSGEVGSARVQGLDLDIAVFRKVSGVKIPTALDRAALTDHGLRAQLDRWGEWIGRVAHSLTGNGLDTPSTTFKFFKALRLYRLVRHMEWDVGREMSAQKQQKAEKHLAVLNQVADVLDAANKEMLGFVKRVLGTQGKPIRQDSPFLLPLNRRD